MFDRLTEHAKQSMNLARAAAQEFGHPYIAPEHMLHGILSVGECGAARILSAQKAAVSELLADLRRRMPPAVATEHGQLPFTPSAKRVLEQAMVAAAEAGHAWIGTEHLLVGVSECAGDLLVDALHDRGVWPTSLKQALLTGSVLPEDADVSSKTRLLRGAAQMARNMGDEETARRLEALIHRLSR